MSDPDTGRTLRRDTTPGIFPRGCQSHRKHSWECSQVVETPLTPYPWIKLSRQGSTRR